MDDQTLVQQTPEHPLSSHPVPDTQPQGLNNSRYFYGVIALVILVLGLLGYSWLQNRKNPQKQNLDSVTTNYPINPTATIQPTRRPTDPIINGKKHYTAKGFGITFDYPMEWNITDEFIPTSSNGINESYVQVGKLFIMRNQPPDGPDGSGDVLYEENIIIDKLTARLRIYSYCWNEEVSGVSEYCNKKYGYIVVTINEEDNYWSFSGIDIDSKADVQERLTFIKEILASVKFTD